MDTPKPDWPSPGQVVNYHSRIGGPATKERLRVLAGPNRLDAGRWVVWLEGVTGCVAVEACSRITDGCSRPPDEDRAALAATPADIPPLPGPGKGRVVDPDNPPVSRVDPEGRFRAAIIARAATSEIERAHAILDRAGIPREGQSGTRTIGDRLEELLAGGPDPEVAPLPIILHCPECGTRHVDKGDFATRPHHTHACQHCGLSWRPAIVPTVGVRFLPGFKDAEVPDEG